LIKPRKRLEVSGFFRKISKDLDQASLDRGLAIVLVNEDDSHEGPYYIRRPFDREPGWGISSINYNLSDLLQKAESH